MTLGDLSPLYLQHDGQQSTLRLFLRLRPGVFRLGKEGPKGARTVSLVADAGDPPLAAGEGGAGAHQAPVSGTPGPAAAHPGEAEEAGHAADRLLWGGGLGRPPSWAAAVAAADAAISPAHSRRAGGPLPIPGCPACGIPGFADMALQRSHCGTLVRPPPSPPLPPCVSLLRAPALASLPTNPSPPFPHAPFPILHQGAPTAAAAARAGQPGGAQVRAVPAAPR